MKTQGIRKKKKKKCHKGNDDSSEPMMLCCQKWKGGPQPSLAQYLITPWIFMKSFLGIWRRAWESRVQANWSRAVPGRGTAGWHRVSRPEGCRFGSLVSFSRMWQKHTRVKHTGYPLIKTLNAQSVHQRPRWFLPERCVSAERTVGYWMESILSERREDNSRGHLIINMQYSATELEHLPCLWWWAPPY